MIALDTSAVVAIALGEPEEEAFTEIIGSRHAYIGTPTVLEVKLVLTPRLGSSADVFLEALLKRPSIRCTDFSLAMYRLAAEAFDRYGKGRSPARLNFGDCMSYAVAKAHDVPLLFKATTSPIRTSARHLPEPIYPPPPAWSIETAPLHTKSRAVTKIPALADFRRIVIKVGSALLVDSVRGKVRLAWLTSLAEDVGALHRQGKEIMVVSSGAIALGRTVLSLPKGPLKLEDSQAAAAVGQIALARTWAEALAHEEITAGQILLTLGDTEERRRYLNARSTLARLMDYRAVPVINENDTVATSEIRYGDNDRLAARVATMASADLLVLLSDIDGLYTAPPAQDPEAKHIPVVPRITAEIEGMAGAAGSELSRGGMRTKIEAGKIATSAGTHMVIASGHGKNPLRAIQEGGRCTWFLTGATPARARKAWIGGALEPRGVLHVDAGAVAALKRGASLLPAGVTRIEGLFERGDAVLLRGPDGAEVGRGLVAYDSDHAERIVGRATAEIEDILGVSGRSEMVHRDDMVVGAK